MSIGPQTLEDLAFTTIAPEAVKTILQFCEEGRRWGISVTLSKVLDIFRSFQKFELLNRGDFYWVLKANLVSSKYEGVRFDEVYRIFFKVGTEKELMENSLPSQLTEENPKPDSEREEERGDGLSDRDSSIGDSSIGASVDWLKMFPVDQKSTDKVEKVLSYSPLEGVMQKDFSEYSEQELRLAMGVTNIIAKLLRTKIGRRKERRSKGQSLDLGTTTRKAVRTDGEILKFVWKRKKVSKTNIVCLCDVSGSMNIYSQFSLLFLQSLAKGNSGVEVFLFSTKLARVTNWLRRWEPGTVLRKVAKHVQGWAGGTRVGECLNSLLYGEGRLYLGKNAVVLVISDGWDVGEIQLLEHSLAKLKRLSKKLIWLNPLMGSPNFKPTCRGMLLAVKYSDKLMPFYNLRSLYQLVQELSLKS